MMSTITTTIQPPIESGGGGGEVSARQTEYVAPLTEVPHPPPSYPGGIAFKHLQSAALDHDG